MRLIDADELKDAIQKVYDEVVKTKGENKPERVLLWCIDKIDNAPTVNLDKNSFVEGFKNGCEHGKHCYKRPQGELVEFADFVARNVVSEDFSEDVDFYAEVLCRKLVKLGLVKLNGDTYEYCGKDMRGDIDG